MNSTKLDPALYHAHHILYDEDVSFWLKLAEVCQGPVLELGCGTGRLLIPLAQAGHPTVGLDIDKGMVYFMAQRLITAKVRNASYFQADMRSFHLEQKFSLVLLACNTFSTFSAKDRQAILKSVTRHLTPNGIFATSLPNPYLLQKLSLQSEPEIEDILPHPMDGEPVQISSSWRRDRDSISIFWTYDHLLPNGQITRTQATLRHYLTSPDEYLSDLHSSGLTQIRLYGNFDQTPYRKKSPYMIILASQEELPNL